MAQKPPSRERLDWAAEHAGGPVIAWQALREGGAPWLLELRDAPPVVLRVLSDGAEPARESARVETTALRIAAEAGLPVPRVLAEREEEGRALLLIEARSGSSRIPERPGPGRLEALGAIAARVHAVAAPEGLPLRTRPIAGVDFDELRRSAPPQELLVRAEEAVAAAADRIAAAPAGFVHGDLWQGNVLFDGDALSAVLDWDCAGAGPAGVDLGSLRCDAAITFGPEAAAGVLAGWEAAAGRPAEDVALWDVVAALSTPPDLAWFVEAIRDQGRPDLTHELLLERRDAFLREALEALPLSASPAPP